MHYNYEYKRNAVELYRQGKWPDTPESIKNPECFRAMIRRWARIENAKGPEALKHQGMNKAWTPEEKLELITKVLAGNSITSVALEAGINDGMLYRWVRKYEELGYNGLIQMKKGRPMKNPKMKTINEVKDSFVVENKCDFKYNVEMIPAENCAGVICTADNLLYENDKYFRF